MIEMPTTKNRITEIRSTRASGTAIIPAPVLGVVTLRIRPPISSAIRAIARFVLAAWEFRKSGTRFATVGHRNRTWLFSVIANVKRPNTPVAHLPPEIGLGDLQGAARPRTSNMEINSVRVGLASFETGDKVRGCWRVDSRAGANGRHPTFCLVRPPANRDRQKVPFFPIWNDRLNSLPPLRLLEFLP